MAVVVQTPIDTCLRDFGTLPLIDVRSPAEFARGHIPGAVNIPLFSDEERTEVSIVYNRGSRQKAIDLGIQFVQPKLLAFIEQSLEVAPGREVIIHCWRGGMRSSSFAAHLAKNGFNKVLVIENGYKAYRSHLLAYFERSFVFHVLGGYSGSGKTEILHCLEKLGQQVVDLEAMAHHRGSAFGGIGMPPQPGTEQFENNLFAKLRTLDPSQPVWIEDESNAIGRVNIPRALFKQMSKAPLLFLVIPLQERVKHLVETYAVMNRECLADSIRKLAKRIGFDQAKFALIALENADFEKVAEIMLFFYDKYYYKGSQKREPSNVMTVELDTVNHEENAKILLRKFADGIDIK